jgi:hypothetical protein
MREIHLIKLAELLSECLDKDNTKRPKAEEVLNRIETDMRCLTKF